MTSEKDRDPIARMFDVATNYEAETLLALSLRAGLVWECQDTGTEEEPLDPCYTRNEEDDARCYACGAAKPEPAPAAVTAGCGQR